MAKSPEEAIASMIANFKEKTGKTLEQWLKIAAAAKLTRHGEVMNLLKKEHGLSHGYANLVALRLFKSGASDADPDELLAQQYGGPKSALRPIYDRLAAEIGKLGKDVEFAPKKAYVSIRRAKQFAIIQPTTATRVDLGINLKGTEPQGRLEASGSFNAMVSHRVRLGALEDIDKELVGWLKKAYQAAG